ncbi:MAG: hypothetical protein ABRQ24_08105 [Syntrophomonadaceae bacterium]
MGIKVLPQTRTGIWAVALFAAAVLLFWAAVDWPGLARSPDLPDFRVAPVFAGLMYLGLAAAISAALLGLRSISRYHEKALLVYISIPLGVFYLVGITVMLIAFQVEKMGGFR